MNLGKTQKGYEALLFHLFVGALSSSTKFSDARYQKGRNAYHFSTIFLHSIMDYRPGGM
jgi:hypothetical protein